jgi:hypothetical protein
MGKVGKVGTVECKGVLSIVQHILKHILCEVMR